MNSSAPCPTPPFFTFFHPHNSDPNPNFFHCQPQNSPPSISELNLRQTLINDTERLSLLPYPFNPHHRLPPHFLFRHSLLCPSSLQPLIDPNYLLQPLLYPQTLKPSLQSPFLQKLPNSDAHLCFSLDDYTDFGSNFVYHDCPAVVGLPDRDGLDKMFTLPRVLAVECSIFSSNCDVEKTNVQKERFRILPSELWNLRIDVGAWNDYPFEYSIGVLCAISSIRRVKVQDLKTWVVANSPRYGGVIGLAMRDHIFVLFHLCLKAIFKEALCSAEKLADGDSKSVSYKCPILAKVLLWLTSQLSIL